MINNKITVKTTTKEKFRRNRLESTFGLDDSFSGILETLVDDIYKEKPLHYLSLRNAISLCLLDLKVTDAPHYRILENYYMKNYNLIPYVGIDGILNAAVVDHIAKEIEKKYLNKMSVLLAQDFIKDNMIEGVYYFEDKIEEFLNVINHKDYENIVDMFDKAKEVLTSNNFATISCGKTMGVGAIVWSNEISGTSTIIKTTSKPKRIEVTPGITVVVMENEISPDLEMMITVKENNIMKRLTYRK